MRALALVLLLAGCGGITWPVALTAGGAALGFSAKALDLDRAIIERREEPVCKPVPRRDEIDPDAEPDDDPVLLIDI